MYWSHSYSTNPYYYPEKHGLTTVFQADGSSGFYEFELFVVWQDKDGKLWWATDSGCSCPLPFEDVNGFHDLDDSDVLEAFDFWADRDYIDVDPSDRANLVAALSKLKD